MKKIIGILVAAMLLATVSVASAEENLILALSYRKGQTENVASSEKIWIADVKFFKNPNETGKIRNNVDYSSETGLINFYDAGLGEKAVRLASVGFVSAALIHPLGHLQEAGKNGVSASINYRTMSESWQIQGSLKKEVEINGAGFQMQDEFAKVVNSPEIYLFNTFYKVVYPWVVKNNNKIHYYYAAGDIGGIKLSGNKYVKELINISAIFDLARSFESKATWDVSFSTFKQGMPGLVFSIYIDENLMPIWSR
ncbi:MAG: hypothetical protein AAB623_00655 [Patescibacteria group bacterium]